MVLPLTRTGSRTSPRVRSRVHSASQALKYSNCTAGSPALPPLTNSPNHAFSTPSSAHSSCDDAYQCFALARANALQVSALPFPFALRVTPTPSIRHTVHSSSTAPVLRPRNSFSIGNIQKLKHISGPGHVVIILPLSHAPLSLCHSKVSPSPLPTAHAYLILAGFVSDLAAERPRS